MSTQPLQASDPRQIGSYRLVGRLGEGGMGQVFLGNSPGGRPVAVKVIRPEHAADHEFRTRFAREVEAARKVGGFHTAPVVDADPYGDPPWMVTAYIAGPSLQTLVTRGGPLTPGAVSALGAALAEGLGAIHACGLVHRDLKPGNVIMADDGPRIIDFGIALAAGATALTTHGTVIGTCSYMSPEQLSADTATPESDIFSLGCVLTYAANCRGPFDASSLPAIMHRVLSEPPDLGGLSGLLRDTLSACLSKEPAGRPPIPRLLARFNEGSAAALATARDELASAVATISGQVAPAHHGVPASRETEHAAAVNAGAPENVAIAKVDAERNENVSISQHANASPGGVVIQVAGDAKIGDATLGARERAPGKGTGPDDHRSWRGAT